MLNTERISQHWWTLFN